MQKHRLLIGLLSTALMSSALPTLAEDIPTVSYGANSITINSCDDSDYTTYAASNNLYKFVAPHTGSLLVYTESGGRLDTFGSLFDANQEYLACDDDSHENSHFQFSYDVEKGQVYYIGVKIYGGFSYDKPVSLYIYCSHEGDHDIETITAKSATCTQAGTKAGYHCAACNTYFSDAKGENVMTDTSSLVTAPLGHTLNKEGLCTRCNHQFNLLTLGENTIFVNAWDNSTAEITDYSDDDPNLYAFVAPDNANLHICKNEVDESIYFILYDAAGTELNCQQYDVEAACQPNDVYFVKIANLYGEAVENFPFLVFGPHEGAHTGNGEISVGRPATCEQDGYCDYYYCEICSKLFSDAALTQPFNNPYNPEEPNNTIIPALGHSFGADNHCVHEGCTLSAKPLSLGENTFNIAAQSSNFDELNKETYGDNLYYLPASNTGEYRIYSEIPDVKAMQFMQYNYINMGDNLGLDHSFTIDDQRFNLIGFRESTGSAVENFKINIYCSHDGDHTLKQIYEKLPTCETDGYREHYFCTVCGKSFSDSSCSEEVDRKDGHYKTGHEFDSNGKCTHEGCTYSIGTSTLSCGQNTITIAYNPKYNSPTVYKDQIFAFTAPVSGELIIEAPNGIMVAHLGPDALFNNIYDGGLTVNIDQSSTYYFAFCASKERLAGDQIITVRYEYHNDACQLVDQPEVAPTCHTSGYQACQICKYCRRTFDAQGEEFPDAEISPLGHSMKDGECEHGCGLKATELKIGEQTFTLKANASDSTPDIEFYNCTDNLFYIVQPINGYLAFDIIGQENDQVRYFMADYFENCLLSTNTFTNYHSFNENAYAGRSYFLGLHSKTATDIKIRAYIYHEGDHSLKHIDAQPATCTLDGYNECWECEYCLAKYRDEDGNEFDWENPYETSPLGHDLNADGECTREGCDFKVKTINIGENTLTIGTPMPNTDWRSWEWFGDNIFIYHSQHLSNNYQLNCEGYNEYRWFNADHTDAEFPLQQNTDYYVGIVLPEVQSPTEAIVSLYVNHDEEGAVHDTEDCEAIESTCTQMGWPAHKHCKICNARYWYDEDNSERGDMLPALGHDMHDGHCSRCDLAGKEIKLGDSNISMVADDQLYQRYEIANYPNNLYYFIAPVDGQFELTVKGEEPAYRAIWNSTEDLLSLMTDTENSDKTELPLSKGSMILIGIKSQSGSAVQDFPVFLYMPQEGDINHDGKITAADVTALVKLVLEVEGEE